MIRALTILFFFIYYFYSTFLSLYRIYNLPANVLTTFNSLSLIEKSSTKYELSNVSIVVELGKLVIITLTLQNKNYLHQSSRKSFIAPTVNKTKPERHIHKHKTIIKKPSKGKHPLLLSPPNLLWLQCTKCTYVSLRLSLIRINGH